MSAPQTNRAVSKRIFRHILTEYLSLLLCCLLGFLVLFLVLIASETALTVWHYLKQAPLWVQVAYGVILAGLPLLTRVLGRRPGRRLVRARAE